MRERQSLEDTFLEWNAKIKRRKSNAIELVDRGHEIFDVYGLGQPSGWGPRDNSGEKFHIVCRVSIGDGQHSVQKHEQRAAKGRGLVRYQLFYAEPRSRGTGKIFSIFSRYPLLHYRHVPPLSPMIPSSFAASAATLSQVPEWSLNRIFCTRPPRTRTGSTFDIPKSRVGSHPVPRPSFG